MYLILPITAAAKQRCGPLHTLFLVLHLFLSAHLIHCEAMVCVACYFVGHEPLGGRVIFDQVWISD